MPAALLYLLFLNKRTPTAEATQPLSFPTNRTATESEEPCEKHTLLYSLFSMLVGLLIAGLLSFAAFIAGSATYILAHLSFHFLFISTPDYAQAIMTAIFSVLFAVLLGLILFCMYILVQSILPKHSK